MVLQFQPSHVWHLQIGDQAFRDAARQVFDKLTRGFKNLQFVRGSFKEPPQRCSYGRIIFDDGNSSGHCHIRSVAGDEVDALARNEVITTKLKISFPMVGNLREQRRPAKPQATNTPGSPITSLTRASTVSGTRTYTADD